jgi:anti-sigma B factor antagonist
MHASTALNDRILTVTISGELDATTVAELRALLEPVMDQAPSGLVVEIEGLRLIDSSGIGVLVYLYRRLRATGRTFLVRGASDQPLSILRLMKLDQVFLHAEDGSPLAHR